MITAALGEHITEHFLEAKRHESGAVHPQVSRWEIDNYLGKY